MEIKTVLDIDIYSKYNIKNFNIGTISRHCMESYKAIIFISSTGIAVRSISPYIKSKDIDPAVIVIDCTGKFVISLLSGHLGGANELTLKLANIIDANPVITTASDNLGFTSPDMIAKENGLFIDNLKQCKAISALLVEGKNVGIIDEEGKISCQAGYMKTSLNNIKNLKGLIYITNKDDISNLIDIGANEKTSELIISKLVRKNIIVGIGCRKNYNSKKMLNNTYEELKKLNIDNRAVKTVSTIEVKKDEEAIIMLSKALNSELKIWRCDQVKIVAENYLGSDFVEKTIGVRAVSEPCVELSGGILLTGKIVIEGMTLCIGKQTNLSKEN